MLGFEIHFKVDSPVPDTSWAVRLVISN